MTRGPVKVMIAGGGVAALEAMIALRHLAEERVQIELVTPKPEFAYRPLAVAEPFGLGEARHYDLVRIATDHGAALHLAGLEAVEPDRRQIITWNGRALDFDVLLLAVGARSATSIPGSVTIAGPGYTNRFRTVLRELEERRIHRIVFAVPPGTSWPLPLYELALMTATRVAERGLRNVELSLVTPEGAPLEIFGARASQTVGDLLAERAVALHTARHPAEFRDAELAFTPSGGVAAERVISLPRLLGPELPGVPHDVQGFIPVDLHGLVQGELDIYAAGDATTSPIKQGGVATQQADAAAEAIAARAGAGIEPKEFRPVLRGLLLTGSTPRYMRTKVGGGRGADWEVSQHALWWPPSKVAGRWLAPYLALHHEELEEPSGLAVEVVVDSPPIKRHAIIVPSNGKKIAL
ncbi:MAG TPA: FAD/NAD(P)-binding oxidoreductase [Thermoleophilaceae bacterium]|nr:FAD/NAD(P)-binding oxidoreductase [Thermoleophilaceae bacterium]